jgi:hypothetical protein
MSCGSTLLCLTAALVLGLVPAGAWGRRPEFSLQHDDDDGFSGRRDSDHDPAGDARRYPGRRRADSGRVHRDAEERDASLACTQSCVISCPKGLSNGQ